MKRDGFCSGIRRCRLPLLLLATAAAAATPSMCAAEPVQTFESELARLAGRASVQCGIFTTAHDGRIVDDSRAGWQCALDARRKGQAYRFALEGRGEDSLVGEAAIRTAARENLVLHYDSNAVGGRPAKPTFRTVTCQDSITVRPAEWPRFQCRLRTLQIGVTNDAFAVDGLTTASSAQLSEAIHSSGATACHVVPARSAAYQQVETAMLVARDAGCLPGIIGNVAR